MLDHAAALCGIGRFEDGAKVLSDARALNPNDHVVAWRSGLELCRAGNWSQGLAELAMHRILDPEQWKSNVLRRFRHPHWQGAEISDKSLLMWAEQGLGDQVMQARAIPALTNIAKDLTIECNRRLIPLFQRSFLQIGDLQFEPQTTRSQDALNTRPFDLQSSLLLAWRFVQPPPWQPQPQYLIPDLELVDAFRSNWKERGWTQNIGLSWRSVAPGHGRLRSLTLEATRPWRRLGSTFHSLQYDATPEELQAEVASSDLPLEWDQDGDVRTDIDRLAARIATLDLVITIDNTTAHLAGAIGTPCWLLLPLARDWRWGLPGAETGLYQSVRIFSNDQADRWGGIVVDVASALQAEVIQRS
ncbi:MAG: hypothetical protein AAF557_21725 [Pseudomonadota bacterium]